MKSPRELTVSGRPISRRQLLKMMGLAAGAAAVAPLLSACGEKPAPAPTAAPAPTVGQVAEPTTVPAEPTAVPAASEPSVIQLWSTAWFPSSIGGRMALVDKFNKAFAGKVKCEFIQGDWGSITTYIQNGVAAGGGIACIVEAAFDLALDYYRRGWIQDLRPYLTDERRKLMIEEQWKARTYPDDGAIVCNGTVLSEPLLLTLYNPKQLEAARIQPATMDDPWNWDKMIENAKLLTLDANGKHLGEDGFDKANVVQWGFLPRLENEKVYEWGFWFAQQAQGKPVVRLEDGKWGWYLNDRAKEVYKKFLTVIDEGVTPDLAIGLGGDTLHQAFVDGKASLILRETFAIPIIHDNYPDFEIGAMPVPFEKGDKVLYQAGGECMVLVKSCDHPAESADFMFWMMEPENLAPYAYGNGMLPANYAALDVEPLASDPAWRIVKDYLARGQVVSVPYNQYWPEFRDTVVGPTLMEVVSRKKTFEEANKILEEQGSKLLNQ